MFRYPLFLSSLRPRLLIRYSLFLLGKNRDCYLDILCFYLTQIGTVIQISSVSTRITQILRLTRGCAVRPASILILKFQRSLKFLLLGTAIQISFVSTWIPQISRLTSGRAIRLTISTIPD